MRAARDSSPSFGEDRSVRRVALEILLESDASDVFIDEVLERRMGPFDTRDRHLLQEIVYGTMRHRNTLDYLLRVYLRVPLPRQRREVRWALRLGAYQVAYLSRVPAHAALDQTLEGLKGLAARRRGDVGFANAVLRRVVRDVRGKRLEAPEDLDDPTALPARDGYVYFRRPVLPLYGIDPIAHLAVRHSHPGWLVRRWVERFGEEETRQLLQAQNRTPNVTARCTACAPSVREVIAELETEGFAASAGAIDRTVTIAGGPALGSSRLLERGWLQVQDITAMQPALALSPPHGARVLDLCSAPGGKAVQLLEAVGEDGHVVAADRSAERLALVRENLGRVSQNFTVVEIPSDPEKIDIGERFTHVLLDVPCSNTGVLARRPDARWRIREEDLTGLVDLQRGLLAAAVRHLRPRGRVVYSTCSLEPEENEERVAEVVSRHRELIELDSRLFLPHRTDADGGFYSLLRDTSGQEAR